MQSGAGLCKWIWLGPRGKHHRILATGIKYHLFIHPSVVIEHSLTIMRHYMCKYNPETMELLKCSLQNYSLEEYFYGAFGIL